MTKVPIGAFVILFNQTFVQGLDDGLLIHVLANEYQFLHPIAVRLVPVASQALILGHHLAKLTLGHGGEPRLGMVANHAPALRN